MVRESIPGQVPKYPTPGPSCAPGVHRVSVLGQATSLSVSASLPLTQEVEQPLPHLVTGVLNEGGTTGAMNHTPQTHELIYLHAPTALSRRFLPILQMRRLRHRGASHLPKTTQIVSEGARI